MIGVLIDLLAKSMLENVFSLALIIGREKGECKLIAPRR